MDKVLHERDDAVDNVDDGEDPKQEFFGAFLSGVDHQFQFKW